MTTHTDTRGQESYDPAAEVVEICRDLIRMDTTNYGDGSGRGSGRPPSTSPRCSTRSASRPSSSRVSSGRTNVVARWGSGDGGPAAAARSPGRRTGRGRRLDRAPVLGRDPGRVPLGPRRGRHEGLRRDAAVGRAGPRPRRRRAGAPDRAVLHRRRGGRRPPGRRADREAAAGPARGLHRGDRRGRRVQRDGARPAGLPHRGGREGHGLDAADRPGQRRARVDAAPGQRRDRAQRRGGPDRRPRVAGAADPVDEGAARLDRRAGRRRGDPGERRGPGAGVRPRRPDARRGHPAHHEPDHARGRLQGERRARRGHGARRRAVPARLRGRVLRHPRRARGRRHLRRLRQPAEPAWRRRSTATSWTR